MNRKLENQTRSTYQGEFEEAGHFFWQHIGRQDSHQDENVEGSGNDFAISLGWKFERMPLRGDAFPDQTYFLVSWGSQYV